MKCPLSIINPPGQYSITCSLVRSCSASSFWKRWCGGNAIGFICRDFLSCWLVFQNQRCPDVQERYALQPTLYLGGLSWNFCSPAVHALQSACVYHPQRQMASLSCPTNFVAMKVLLSLNAVKKKKIHPLNLWHLFLVVNDEIQIFCKEASCVHFGGKEAHFLLRGQGIVNLQFAYSTTNNVQEIWKLIPDSTLKK